ncbi:MAG: AAA family ATPase [Planctomycetota bacterium]|nr:MAG: AAA family ATPase [Planctomycetota bacterium]
MANKVNGLIRKLGNVKDLHELSKMGKKVLELYGEEGTYTLLEDLFEHGDRTDKISAILLASYLKDLNLLKDWMEVSKEDEELLFTFLKALVFIGNAKSQKEFLTLLTQITSSPFLEECASLLINEKPSFTAKVLALLLEHNLPQIEAKLHKSMNKWRKKDLVRLLRHLLQSKNQRLRLFALQEMKDHPFHELAPALSKRLSPLWSLEEWEMVLIILGKLPVGQTSREILDKILEYYKEKDRTFQIKVIHEASKWDPNLYITLKTTLQKRFHSQMPDVQKEIILMSQHMPEHQDIPFLLSLFLRGGIYLREMVIQSIDSVFTHQKESLNTFVNFFFKQPEEDQRELKVFFPQLVKNYKKVELEDQVLLLSEEKRRKLTHFLFQEDRGSPLLKACLNFLSKKYQVFAEFGTILPGESGIHQCYEREKEIQIILNRLKGEGNRSMILLGPSGVGKSAIIHELAFRIFFQEDPSFPFEAILQVTTGEILAGTKFLGEWETKLHRLIQSLSKEKKVLLYISNTNDIVWAGRSTSSRTSFASLLAPYIERGEIVIIGESNPESFSIGISSDYSVKKLFHTIQISAMDDLLFEKTLKRLAQEITNRYKNHQNIHIEFPSAVINRIIELANYYFPGIAKPGSGIKLLEQVVEKKISEIQDAHPSSLKKINEKNSKKGIHVILSTDDVMSTLADTMEVPEIIVNDNIPLEIDEVRRFFQERVLGQEDAIDQLVSVIALIKAGLTNPERPNGIFFFIGPTGVGKTELARVLAEYLTGDPDRLIRLDMSAFKDYHSFERLIGSTYHMTAQGEFMTPNFVEKIRNHPFSVILLDEFEKAHPNIWDLFLQVFDYGKLSDVRSNIIDFRQSIIIMTSNIGYEEALEDRVGFDEPLDKSMTLEEAKKEMGRIFRPEFINRIDQVVVFHPLDRKSMVKIAQRELGKILSRSGILRRNLDVKVDATVLDYLLERGFSPKFGARQLKRVVEKDLLQPIAETIVRKNPAHGSILKVTVKDGKVVVSHNESRATSRNTKLLERIRKKNKETTRSITLEQLLKGKEELNKRVQNLEKICEEHQYLSRKRQLLKKTQEITFWDNPIKARQTLEEIHYLERILYSLEKLLKSKETFAQLLQNAVETGSRKEITQCAQKYLENCKEVDILEFEAHCLSPKERADAFFWLTLETPFKKEDRNPLEMLARMYQKWAEKQTFTFLPLWEERFSTGEIKSLFFYIQGVCVYGLLEQERGIHEFVWNHSPVGVQVSVYPRLIYSYDREDFETTTKEEFNLPQSYFFEEANRLVEVRYHLGREVWKGYCQEEKEDQIISLLKDFHFTRSHEPPIKEVSKVRTYYLSPPAPYVYDHLLEKSFSNAYEILEGEVDELFLSRTKKIKEVSYENNRNG